MRRSASITIRMTFDTVHSNVRSSQREICQVVIKSSLSIAGWMACKTCRTVVGISIHACMFFICFRLHVAGRAPRVAAASVEDVDLGVLFDGKHEPLAGFHVNRRVSFYSESGHSVIIPLTYTVPESWESGIR